MKILIADDHALVREGLRYSLKSLAEDMEVVEAKNGEEVQFMLAQHADINIVLLDLFMPGSDGFNLLKSLCENETNPPVVVLSASENPGNMRRAIDLGASGYVPKSASREVMLSALQLVLSGGVYIPSSMYLGKDEDLDHGMPESRVIRSGEAPHLTERQKEVLDYLAQGKTNKEIARLLGLSEYTVKIHITAIFKALKVRNRTEAVVLAKQFGLLSKDSAAQVNS